MKNKRLFITFSVIFTALFFSLFFLYRIAVEKIEIKNEISQANITQSSFGIIPLYLTLNSYDVWKHTITDTEYSRIIPKKIIFLFTSNPQISPILGTRNHSLVSMGAKNIDSNTTKISIFLNWSDLSKTPLNDLGPVLSSAMLRSVLRLQDENPTITIQKEGEIDQKIRTYMILFRHLLPVKIHESNQSKQCLFCINQVYAAGSCDWNGATTCGIWESVCNCSDGSGTCVPGDVCGQFGSGTCNCSTNCVPDGGIAPHCNLGYSSSTCASISICGQGACSLGSGGCSWTCIPSCSSPSCGQSNGCGGSCSSSDVGNCSAPYCGQSDPCGNACSSSDTTNWTDTGNVSGCGNSATKEQSNPCGGTQWVSLGSCRECGGYPQAWGACSSATFTRSRTVTYDCQGNTTATENCLGTISGTYFDATDFTCPELALAPKVAGGTTQMDATLYAPPITYTATTNTSGVYTQSVRVPDTYTLSETVPAGSGYLAIPRYVCTGDVVTLTTQGQTATRDYGWWTSIPAWFQVMGGTMGAEASSGVAIQTYVPSSCVGSPCAPRAILAKDTAGTPESSGVAVVGPTASIVTTTGPSTLANLNEEGTNVYAQSARSARRENYGEFYRRFSLGSTPTTLANTQLGGPGGITLGNLAQPDPIDNPPERGAYYAPGDTTIATAWSVASTEKIVIFVNGNLTIAAPITVAQGGFLALIATGDITIDASVGTSDITSTTPQVEGVYIANGMFTVASTGLKQGDLKFVGAGTFVGWTGVSLNRDFRLGDDTTEGLKNFDQPGELFLARPDFVLNLPKKMARPVTDWQEVAP